MKDTFQRAMPHVFQIEGGYVDHPKDPGGATNKGITIRTLSAWRGRPVSKGEVKNLSSEEASAIYRAQYWDKISGDKLPAGLDYALFDFAINSGVSRAAKFIQRIVGVKQDGIIGAQTLAAIGRYETLSLINRLCDERLAWLKGLSTWSTFGRGWARRVEHVRETARSFAFVQSPPPPETAPEAHAKAEQSDIALTETLKKPEAWGPLGGVVSAFGALMSGDGPAQWALAAIMVILVLVGVWYFVGRVRREA